MSAVIRMYGKDFNVDAFVANCTLPVCAVKRRGEPVFPASQPDGRRHEQSGVHVLASEADCAAFRRRLTKSSRSFEEMNSSFADFELLPASRPPHWTLESNDG